MSFQGGTHETRAKEHFQRSACRRHRRQGRRNACCSWLALKRPLLGCVVPRGDTREKAEGTLSKKRLSETQETRPMERLVVLGCSHPESKTLGRQNVQPRPKSKAVAEGTSDGLGEKLVAQADQRRNRNQNIAKRRTTITTQDHDNGVSVSWLVNFMEEMDATGSISWVTKRCYIVIPLCSKWRRSQHKTPTTPFSLSVSWFVNGFFPN